MDPEYGKLCTGPAALLVAAGQQNGGLLTWRVPLAELTPAEASSSGEAVAHRSFVRCAHGTMAVTGLEWLAAPGEPLRLLSCGHQGDAKSWHAPDGQVALPTLPLHALSPLHCILLTPLSATA